MCQHLLAQGYRVRALIRSPERAQSLKTMGVSLVEGDLANTPALEQLVADCTAVVHGAGAVRGNSQEDFDRVNVAGTARLLSALEKQANTPKLLLLSSLVAREPQLSWYSRSKREGEKLVEQLPPSRFIILRPPAVYGPGDKEMLPIFQWMQQRGIALVPGSPEARISLIHVADLVPAIEACLHSDKALGQTLSLCDGRDEGYNWREMADIAQDVFSRKVTLFEVPRWLLNSIARCNSALASTTGRTPMLTPPKLRELRHENWVVDNRAITQATGWRASMELAAGLKSLNLTAN